MTECPECDRPVARVDDYRVRCKAGHTWVLPEHADKATVPYAARRAGEDPVRVVVAPKFPAWLPGAVLGGLALLVSILEVVL